LSHLLFRDIILEDNENDPNIAVNGIRQSRPGRHPRPSVNQGREREFNGEALSRMNQADETEALLRRIRQ